ncbi:MAG: glycosyltransferase family 9 protein [Bdellovibrionota bacterium]
MNRVKKKVLLIRLDKIGDLICTLPTDQILDDENYDITWIIQKGLGPVVDLGTKKRKYFELDKSAPAKSAHQLREFLKTSEPDLAISFQCPWWVNYELYNADVPIRAGVKSQWHSFLFLNHAIRQKRSKAEKHEFEYNLDLVIHSLNPKQSKQFQYFEIAKPNTTEILQKYNLAENKYVVVHPGMMGSALNWPQSEYIKYIHHLIEQKKHVVITGTDQDENYLTEIKKEFHSTHSSNPNVSWLQSKLSLKELIQVLAYSEFVIAPSTGVAHLAASVGAHIKTIFSPIRVHHPKRWSPRGPNVEILMLDETTLQIENFY